MADVFLSYQHDDRAWVERVDAALRAAGLTTWWDRDLQAGQRWDQEIRVQHKAARCVVVVWSERSWASDYVQSEASRGHTRRILVAARLDDVDVDIPFNLVQTVDLREPAGLDALVRGARAMVAREPEPVRLALPPAPRRRTHVIAAKADRTRVARELALLRQEGIDIVWEASAGVLTPAVQASISEADGVFVFWSSAARRDPRVEAELEFAEVVGRTREAAGQAGAEGFLTAVALDDTELPKELSTKPGRIGGTVWLSLLGVVGAGGWAVTRGQPTGWTWALLGFALALTLGVGFLQVMRRGDRLLRAGRVYAAGQWLDRARAVELIAVSEGILDRIFGVRVISFRAFFVSALFSTLSVVVPIVAAWGAYGASGGSGIDAATGAGFGAVIGVPLAMGNVFFDFVSLLVTRLALKRIVAKPSLGRLWFGLALDSTVAATCAVAALFSNLMGAAMFTFARPMDLTSTADWTAWPRVVLGTTWLAATGGLRLQNAFVDPLIGFVLVTAIATVTSMLPSLTHGTLLAIGLGNRVLGHLPLRVLGEGFRRTADSPRGPWTVALPVLVAGLATGAVGAAEERILTVDELVAGRWAPIDPAQCGEPCLIGCEPRETGCTDDEQQRAVEPLPEPYDLLKTEVWQALWTAVWDAGGPVDSDRFGLSRHPSTFEGGELPVENVSWCDAARFANLWSLVEGRVPFYGTADAPQLPDCETQGADRRADGTGYRLPTEEEWELAARGGARTTYWSGNNLADLLAVDFVRWNSGFHTHPVGSTPDEAALRRYPHPFGLRGIHGNVGEWTESLYDPSGPPGGGRVFRGGSWNGVAVFARAAFRWADDPGSRDPDQGFRLARPLAPQPAGP